MSDAQNVDLAKIAASTALTAAEFGRQYAPDEIKDREGWGRRFFKRHKSEVAVTAESVRDFHGAVDMTQSEIARYALEMRGDPHHYRAPHALRGTPQRKRRNKPISNAKRRYHDRAFVNA